VYVCMCRCTLWDCVSACVSVGKACLFVSSSSHNYVSGMATQKDARMDGFVEFERNNTEYCGVMKMFAPGKVSLYLHLHEL